MSDQARANTSEQLSFFIKKRYPVYMNSIYICIFYVFNDPVKVRDN